MEQWIAQNPAVVLLVMGLLASAVLILGRLVWKKEVGRVDRLEQADAELAKQLREHMGREEEVLGAMRRDTQVALAAVQADITELKLRIRPRSESVNGEFRQVVSELRALVLEFRNLRSRGGAA